MLKKMRKKVLLTTKMPEIELHKPGMTRKYQAMIFQVVFGEICKFQMTERTYFETFFVSYEFFKRLPRSALYKIIKMKS